MRWVSDAKQLTMCEQRLLVEQLGICNLPDHHRVMFLLMFRNWLGLGLATICWVEGLAC